MFENIKSKVESTEYKNYQVYFFIICLLFSFGLYFDIDLIIFFWSFLDENNVIRISEEHSIKTYNLLISALNGVITGFLGLYLYKEGERYYKTGGNNDFGSKESAFAVKIFVMTLIGFILYDILPGFIEKHAEYPSTQTLALVLALGTVLVNEEIDYWKLENDYPFFAGSIFLALAPFIL